ncbi:MAG TPA: response regulator [Steroidobacteraceae bacterium]|nr:response regulator [Steroidobacteraceae bacterium]
MNAKIRILLVDDEAAFTRALKLNLEDTDRYEVSVVNDSTLAIDVARQIRPDVVVLDLMMPEMDGPEVAEAMRDISYLSATPVIFLTALVRKAEEKGLRKGDVATKYLGKPVTVAELDAAVAEVLRSRREES